MNSAGVSIIRSVARRVRRLIQGDPDSFLRKTRGVIHVGANLGQERATYAQHNLIVLWIEPIPEIFERLKTGIAEYPTQKALCGLITDVDDKECAFHVSNYEGVSSSILDFAEHKQLWPDISYERTIQLKGITLSSLLQREGIDAGQYDSLVLDTQGSELLVLKGAANILPGFRFIKCEASDFESYKGCCQLSDLESFLAQHRFRLAAKSRFASKPGIGSYFDVLFTRSPV
jgi:FkbM family methyltransferase